MGGVHVAAKYDGFLLAELLYEREECVVEAHFVVEALRALAAVGEVGVYEPEILELSPDKASLLVEFLYSHAINDFQGLDFGINSDAAVAFPHLAG